MKDIPTLNTLIETLKDGEAGFRAAATDAQSDELRNVLSDLSIQRARFASQLQSLARTLGEAEPPNGGSLAGAVHRGWINLKAAVVTRNANAILTECERGEDSAVAAYEKALAEPELFAQVREVISTQLGDVRAAHDRIRYLRDSEQAVKQ